MCVQITRARIALSVIVIAARGQAMGSSTFMLCFDVVGKKMGTCEPFSMVVFAAKEGAMVPHK
jgi:hypothetical protein